MDNLQVKTKEDLDALRKLCNDVKCVFEFAMHNVFKTVLNVEKKTTQRNVPYFEHLRIRFRTESF